MIKYKQCQNSQFKESLYIRVGVHVNKEEGWMERKIKSAWLFLFWELHGIYLIKFMKPFSKKNHPITTNTSKSGVNTI
jgi:hypothetical protein